MIAVKMVFVEFFVAKKSKFGGELPLGPDGYGSGAIRSLMH